MRKYLPTLIFALSLLIAAPDAPHKDCPKVTNFFQIMDKSTLINHKNLMMLKDILQDPSKSKEEKENALKALEDMNIKTASRAKNSEYNNVYREMKAVYIANCDSFTEENNETLNGMIKRSIQFNKIMAELLGDDLSISKTK
jgi:hypothetical protein